jgi:exosortase/archaeosortase family protein
MLISRSDQSPVCAAVLPIVGRVSRGEFFGALLILGCVNGLGSRIIQSVNRLGWADALSSTFEISVIVWLSCIAGISIILRDRTEDVRPADFAVGAGFLLLVILPIGPLSWLAVTALCLYVLVSTNDPTLRRGAVILFATTVPMLWSRMLFQLFANRILEVDASLVGWLLGTHRTGNLVEFADGSGLLVILPTCSSLANVSLAFLCWVSVSRFVRHKRSPYDVLWCLLACASVVAVNVTRISMMGLSQSQYDEIHNQWGDAVANVIILCLTIGFSVLGVRRELFSRT